MTDIRPFFGLPPRPPPVAPVADVPNYQVCDCPAMLKLWVDPTIPGLRESYEIHVAKHNEAVQSTPFPNAGFDLFMPEDCVIPPMMDTTTKINLSVRCEMYTEGIHPFPSMQRQSTGYYLMPRSSMSNTPLMQSNHVGLFDSGYRGDVILPLRNLSDNDYPIYAFSRLVQLCHPSTRPIVVHLVDDPSELSCTERGEGRFGSTGIVGAFR